MSSVTASGRTVNADFLRSRLGSFLAVVPLGVWTIVHLWNNLAIFEGGEAWQSAVTEYPHPVAFVASSLVALLPLVIHTVWGLFRIATARPNLLQYRFFGNLKYVLQRLSAIGILLFLGAHLWLAMLQPRLVKGRPEPIAAIAHELHHHAPTLIVYVLGVLGVAYHLANGFQTFLMGWGVVSSRRALRKLDVFVVLFFLTLLAMGWGAVYGMWSVGAST